jgi:hypothetical protein
MKFKLILEENTYIPNRGYPLYSTVSPVQDFIIPTIIITIDDCIDPVEIFMELYSQNKIFAIQTKLRESDPWTSNVDDRLLALITLPKN